MSSEMLDGFTPGGGHHDHLWYALFVGGLAVIAVAVLIVRFL